MRLSPQHVALIKESFKECFLYGDKLFLFGSRVDDSLKGGDIDLYIETECTDSSRVFKRRMQFIGLLHRKLGEQKIDVVIKTPLDEASKLIYKEAQRAGILMMKKETPLEFHIATADRHAKRLGEAVLYVQKLSPVTSLDIETLPPKDISFLDMLSMRFSKLQDLLGSRIFIKILELCEEKEFITIIDKLNRLEKLGYLESASWWISLRDLRNDITHDYPDDTHVIAEHVNGLVIKSCELLNYWKELKPKVEVLVEKQILAEHK